MNDVLGIPPASTGKHPLIVGLLPCWNRDFLDPAWSVVRPGVEELAQIALGEFDPYWVWQQIYSGQFQLYVGYTDLTGKATPKEYQMMFPEKLRTPEKDYLGFFILDVFRKKAIHVFAAYIMPEFRGRGIYEMAYDYIESQVKMIGAKEVTATVSKEAAEAMKVRGFETGLVNVRKILK
jgi:ribosomal protein S18 acetylase RimI-like enzyme